VSCRVEATPRYDVLRFGLTSTLLDSADTVSSDETEVDSRCDVQVH
jgi:hypothetical protein